MNKAIQSSIRCCLKANTHKHRVPITAEDSKHRESGFDVISVTCDRHPFSGVDVKLTHANNKINEWSRIQAHSGRLQYRTCAWICGRDRGPS